MWDIVPGEPEDRLRFGSGAERSEKTAPDGRQGGDLAAANEPREVPAGKFLPHVTPRVDREEVPGGPQLLGQMAANVEVADAGRIGRMIAEGRAGVADEDRDLLDAGDVRELRERDGEPGTAGIDRRCRRGDRRRQLRPQRSRRRQHPLTSRPRRGRRDAVVGRRGDGRRPADALGVVDAPGQPRGDEVDDVVEHEVAKRGRQEGVSKAGLDAIES